MKRLSQVIAGSVLVIVFLAWLVFRFCAPVREFVGMETPLGWVAAGLATACLFGGVALLARAIFAANPDAAAPPSETE